MLLDYFAHRAKVLVEIAEPNLMDADEALAEFEALRARVQPQRPFAMNKQKVRRLDQHS